MTCCKVLINVGNVEIVDSMDTGLCPESMVNVIQTRRIAILVRLETGGR